jgi:hypothetical protein
LAASRLGPDDGEAGPTRLGRAAAGGEADVFAETGNSGPGTRA